MPLVYVSRSETVDPLAYRVVMHLRNKKLIEEALFLGLEAEAPARSVAVISVPKSTFDMYVRVLDIRRPNEHLICEPHPWLRPAGIVVGVRYHESEVRFQKALKSVPKFVDKIYEQRYGAIPD